MLFRLRIMYGEGDMLLYTVTESDCHLYAIRLSKELDRAIAVEKQVSIIPTEYKLQSCYWKGIGQ